MAVNIYDHGMNRYSLPLSYWLDQPLIANPTRVYEGWGRPLSYWLELPLPHLPVKLRYRVKAGRRVI